MYTSVNYPWTRPDSFLPTSVTISPGGEPAPIQSDGDIDLFPQASKLFGKDPRTGRRWVKDGVQESMIVVLLKLMVTGKVSVQDVERIRIEEESRHDA